MLKKVFIFFKLFVFTLTFYSYGCSDSVESKSIPEDSHFYSKYISSSSKDGSLPSELYPKDTKIVIDKQDQLLWEKGISLMLQKKMWEQNPYNTGHLLMIPLHAAFASGFEPWISEFEQFFQIFTEQYHKNPLEYAKVSNTLSQLHFLYLASEYLVLLKEHNKEVPQELEQIVVVLLEHIWRKPAWQWNRDPFEGGIEERAMWKLRNSRVEKSYYRAIVDHDLFVFAIAANLRFIKAKETPIFLDRALDLDLLF